MGIDEAGRGAVIGPLVIAGVLMDKSLNEELKILGVKDSKMLSSKKREELAEKIEEMAAHIIVVRVPSYKIDKNRREGINLNQLEAIKMAEIIDIGRPTTVYVDAPSFNTEKFKNYLLSKISSKETEIIAENNADKKYPVVSAASIIAKVDRDNQIKKLEKEIGEPIGVGYPHDELTIKHLEKLAEKNKGKMPNYVRVTWDTTKQIIKRYEQKGILGFLGKAFKK